MTHPKRVTLSDIAEEVGLTKVSVSKALRDHPDIATSTKEEIKRVAKEMGYAPNRMAQSLTLDRSGTIGVIIPKMSHTFFADVLAGVNEVASDNQYEIVLCVSEENADFEQKHLRTLLSMQVDGVLVSVSQETRDAEPFQNILDQGLPLVFFDRALDAVEASSVTVDDRSGAYEVVDHAVKKGHRKIAHVAGYSYVNIGERRRAGYEDALSDHGIEIRDSWIVEGGFDEYHGYKGGKEIIASGEIPEAIFAVTFPVALGVADALREHGQELEEKIVIYSFGQHGLNRFFKYPHVSVYQPTAELGAKAVSVLIDEIHHSSRESVHISLPTHVVSSEEQDELPYLKEYQQDGTKYQQDGVGRIA